MHCFSDTGLPDEIERKIRKYIYNRSPERRELCNCVRSLKCKYFVYRLWTGKLTETTMKLGTLITVKQLADALAKFPKNLRVLDASWHVPTTERDAFQEYKDAHIPGALFFDLEGCSNQTSKYLHMLPAPQEFERFVGNLGVNNDTHIVLYENNTTGFFSSPRAWWNFRVFGHYSVSLLDGGFPKWIAEGHPVSNETPVVQKETFKAKFHPEMVGSLGEVLENLKEPKFQLVDARLKNWFSGIDDDPTGIPGGHIPGSLNIPFTNVMTNNDDAKFQTLRSVGELKEIFESNGVDLAKPLTTTCSAGITACTLVLAASMCGKDNVNLKVYDGSWMEYYDRIVQSQSKTEE